MVGVDIPEFRAGRQPKSEGRKSASTPFHLAQTEALRVYAEGYHRIGQQAVRTLRSEYSGFILTYN